MPRQNLLDWLRFVVLVVVTVSATVAMATGATPVLAAATLVDGGTYFVGQDVVTDTFAPGETVVLERGDGTFVSEFIVDEDGFVTVSTDARSAGSYVLTNHDGVARSFDLVTQTLAVSTNRSVAETSGEDTAVEFSTMSNRAEYSLVVTSPGMDATTLKELFGAGSVVDTDADGTPNGISVEGATSTVLTADFAGVAPGDYTFYVTASDTNAGDSVTVTVESSSSSGGDGETSTGGEDEASGSATLAVPSKVVSGSRGNVIGIPIELSDTGRVTLRLGSDDLNYEVELDVVDGGDGSVTVFWDTHLAGQANPESSVFVAAADSDDVSGINRLESPMFDGTRRLDADTYPLRLSVGGRETDVGTVSLSPRTVSVSMSDQRSANGRLLQVDSAYLPDGGFISIHDARAFERGDVAGSILGTSGYLSAGGHDHVRVTLDESLSNGTNRVVAIPYRDVDENAIFDVGHANRQNDEPYEVGGSEVTDSAAVSVPTPTPTKTSSTTTTTTTSATTTTPSATTTSTTLPSTTDEADASANSPGFGGGVTVLALVLAVIAAYLRRPPEEPRP